MALVADLAPATSPQEQYDGLLAGQRYLHSLGVTGWQDAIVGGYGGMDDAGPAYLRAAASGDLTAHVVGALWWSASSASSRSRRWSSAARSTPAGASGRPASRSCRTG